MIDFVYDLDESERKALFEMVRILRGLPIPESEEFGAKDWIRILNMLDEEEDGI